MQGNQNETFIKFPSIIAVKLGCIPGIFKRQFSKFLMVIILALNECTLWLLFWPRVNALYGYCFGLEQMHIIMIILALNECT